LRKILIAGCGYVGQAAAKLFHIAGWSVEGWTKSESQVVRPYRLRSVDLSDAHQVAEAAGEFDAIVHCASTRGGDAQAYCRIYFDAAQNLIRTFPNSTILFTSSTSVYAQQDGEWVTEESETKPVRDTSRILLQVEKLVLENNGIVMRLAGIYGPGRSALLDKFLNGRSGVEKDYFVNQVHRDDIATAMFLLLGDQSSPTGIFNVSDGNPISANDCYRWLAERLGARTPAAASPTSPSLERKRGNTNKRVSNAKMRDFGWRIRFPTFAEGMERSVLPAAGLDLR
jgi:nucleoside-diphosphate-sugar epimerase